MATIIEFMDENELAWQPSFSGELDNGLYGYRGSMIIEEGKQLSPDRKLPPKIQARQVIMINEGEKINFFSCELEQFAHFVPMFEKYKEFFSPDAKNILYVTDIDGNGTFEYEGYKFTAINLYESSVWNELLELLELDKAELKKMKKQEEKLSRLYEEVLEVDMEEAPKTFQEMCDYVGESTKQIMGAV